MARNFVKLRESLKLNKNQFANLLGVRNSVVSTYEKDDRGLGKKMIALIKEKIPNINEAFLKDVSDEMYIKNEKPTETYHELEKSIKVYGSVAAGLPADAWMDYDKITVYHPVLDKIKGQILGFKVAGASMENLFSDGDIILGTQINMPHEMPRDGDFVVVMFRSGPDSSKAIFKQFYWADQKEKFIITELKK